MDFKYKTATQEDIDILVTTRIEVLRAANKLEDQIVGAGGISYFKVMPTYHNQTGKKAYIMNMYTNPAYRRKGIAYHTLEILVADAKNKGIDAISLEATEMGRPLYEEFGFVGMKDEMELK